ncbi:uncharacterized protein TNCV_2389581 [Trichonephila clavipes]|nr:uncharacterized protein TNCV_2389581 [Trichonephila clavipes]
MWVCLRTKLLMSWLCRSSRAHQTALERLRRGHLRSMTFVQGVKSFFTCPWSLLASPAHLLDCWGISLRQLYEEQGRVIVSKRLLRGKRENSALKFGASLIKITSGSDSEYYDGLTIHGLYAAANDAPLLLEREAVQCSLPASWTTPDCTLHASAYVCGTNASLETFVP